MANFTEQVATAAQETDPAQNQKFNDLMQKRVAATAKQFGQMGAAATPQASLGDTLKAERAAEVGEYGRRKEAATGAFQFGKQAGEASASISDRVRQAMLGRQQAQSGIQRQQQELARTGAVEAAGATQQFGTEVNKLGYQNAANEAQRQEAILDQMNRGNIQEYLLGEARNGAIRMADIDRVFQIKMAELENAFKDWESMAKMDAEQVAGRYAADAQQTGAIITGLATITGKGIESANK